MDDDEKNFKNGEHLFDCATKNGFMVYLTG